MKERLRHAQLSTIAGILMVIGLFAGILIIAMILYVVADALNITFMEYIEYALFILIGIWIVKRWLTEYEYIVTNNELHADRYIGKRSKRLFSADLADITYIGKDLPKDFEGNKQRLTYKPKRSGIVYILYETGGETKCAYFSPSEKMLQYIHTKRQNNDASDDQGNDNGND